MEIGNFEIGRVVLATAGRDKGRLFIVVGIVDQNNVLIANGTTSPISKPKRKKIKHLKPKKELITSIREKILGGKRIFDSEISKQLEALGYEE